MSCTVCKGNTGLFSKSCGHGRLCRDCESKIPLFSFYIDEGVARHLCRTYDDKNEQMCKMFQETYRVGDLHFDGIHLLVAIGGVDKNGRLRDGYEGVFSLENVRNLSFSMDKIKITSGKRVFCDVTFSCDFYDSFWSIKHVVSKHETCMVKDDGEMFSYSLPAGVQIVWDDMIRCVNTYRNFVSNAIENELPTEFDLQLYKAKALFLLQTDFTKQEVYDVYDRLKSAFTGDSYRLNELEKARDVLLYVLDCTNRNIMEE